MTVESYVSINEILSIVTALVDDKDYKSLPRGFYASIVQKAIEELAIDTFFQELRQDIDFPVENLTIDLPSGCFNVKNVYMFTGDQCSYQDSHKVWYKKNYYTTGQGYIANNKGDNKGDPFYDSAYYGNTYGDKSLIRQQGNASLERRLFYNIQMGKMMFSSSCRNAGTKVHIHYNGTGAAIGDALLIPVFARTAVEDYTMEYILRYKIAKDSDPRRWQALYNITNSRLNKPYEGSWAKAEYRIRSMNESQRRELCEYLSKPAFGSGF
jgi:hypothetical protein